MLVGDLLDAECFAVVMRPAVLQSIVLIAPVPKKSIGRLLQCTVIEPHQSGTERSRTSMLQTEVEIRPVGSPEALRTDVRRRVVDVDELGQRNGNVGVFVLTLVVDERAQDSVGAEQYERGDEDGDQIRRYGDGKLLLHQILEYVIETRPVGQREVSILISSASGGSGGGHGIAITIELFVVRTRRTLAVELPTALRHLATHAWGRLSSSRLNL